MAVADVVGSGFGSDVLGEDFTVEGGDGDLVISGLPGEEVESPGLVSDRCTLARRGGTFQRDNGACYCRTVLTKVF